MGTLRGTLALSCPLRQIQLLKHSIPTHRLPGASQVGNQLPTMATAPDDIDFLALIRWARDQTLQRLFRPFRIETWMILGFCAWLAGLGQSGYGVNYFGGPGHSGGRKINSATVSAWTNSATDFMQTNWVWILPLVAVVALLLLALWVAIIWISSRGRFLFLEGLMTRRLEVARPWREYAAEAQSLFWFRIWIAIAAMGFGLICGVVGVLAAITLQSHAEWSGIGIALMIGALLLAVPLVVLAAVAWVVQEEIVVPLMWLRRIPCLSAWTAGFHVIRTRPMLFFQFLVARLILAILTGIAIIVFILLTCCIGGLLLALPYFGAVMLLPVTVFFRFLSVGYLAHFGSDHDLLAAGATRSES